MYKKCKEKYKPNKKKNTRNVVSMKQHRISMTFTQIYF